jgi:predicted transcriptional regulator
MNRSFDPTTRLEIQTFVVTHPGASAREVQRSLSLGWGETAYHLDQLLATSTLMRERAGRRDYFFPKDTKLEDRRLHIAFQSSAERALLLTLVKDPDLSFSELADQLRMSKSTLSFHLKFLVATGSVRISTVAGVRRYHLDQPDRVKQLYRKYRSSWGDRWIDRFTSAFGGIMRD